MFMLPLGSRVELGFEPMVETEVRSHNIGAIES